MEETKQICKIPLPLPSQGRDPEVSGLHEIAVKWLRTRVGNPCIDTLVHSDTQIETHTHAHGDNYINTLTCTDSFAVAALDPVSYAPCHHVAEFL